jgi:molybdate transport system regulatory protein
MPRVECAIVGYDPRARNMRPRRITHKGRTQTLTAWARELGISDSTIAYRLNIGHSVGHAPRQTRDTRGRPKAGAGVLLSGRVPPALAAVVDKWAKAHGVSRSQAIRRLVEQALGIRKRSDVPPGLSSSVRFGTMTDTQLCIRIDLTNGRRIGPGKIALLEAIRTKGSISAAARHLGMSYRRAWMLVEQINEALRVPAVSTTQGGQHGGGAVLTLTGERIIELYHTIEELTCSSAQQEFRALAKLVRHNERTRA